MTFKNFLLSVLLFAMFCCMAQSETVSLGNLLYVKLGNGTNAILQPVSNSSATEISLYIKTGSVYEGDSVSGIANVVATVLSEKVKAGLQSKPVSVPSVIYKFSSTTEHAVFKFSTQPSGIDFCLKLLHDSVMSASLRNSEVEKILANIELQTQEKQNSAAYQFDEELMQALYRKERDKLNIYGNIQMHKNIDLHAANFFFKKYYVTNNSYYAIAGNFAYNNAQQALESNLSELVKSDFDPETVSKIIDFHPMVYTSQFIVEDSSSTPEFQICWQFPGTLSNIQASFPAHLLATMLNDKNNFIQAKAASMGCKKFVADYECNEYSGIFRVTIQPAKENLLATYNFVVTELQRLDKTIVNPAMMNAAKLQFKKNFTSLMNTPDFSSFVIKHWAFRDETYFPTLMDSVLDVKEKELVRFVIDYLNQNPHVSGLRISKSLRDELKVDSLFTTVTDSVSNYVFHYRPNIYDLEGEESHLMLRNLLQWLKINRDISIQVNGFSDEHEFSKATDDSVMQFIDSIPTFRKTMPEIIRKGYMRPELMRAMKIVKYFYEQGIEPERLSGTSMVYTSANKKEEEENMRCTVTLNKYHKTPSLYEYHYGKAKSAEPQKTK